MVGGDSLDPELAVSYYFEGPKWYDRVSNKNGYMDKETLTWQRSALSDSYRPIYLPFGNHDGTDNACSHITNAGRSPERLAQSL